MQLMNHQFILWIALLCYAAHMLEEYFYNWKDWVFKTLGLVATWTDFYVVNTYVLFMGVACASIGWNCIWASLVFPGFMLVNAVVFHIIPVIRYRKFSPGVITAVLLFLPVIAFSYYYALQNGGTVTDIFVSILIGAIFMFYPIVLQVTKNKDFFKQ